MRILVTGGAGYVGSRVVGFLLALGNEVRVLDRLLFGGEALTALTVFPQLSIRAGDIRHESDVAAAMRGIDAVVHLAAIVGEAACCIDRELSWQTNHDAIPRLLEMAGIAGIERFIFISTCSNYGVSQPNAVVSEEDALNPLSEYAKAKVGGEQVVLDSNAVPVTTTLRLATICGLSARMRFDLLINEMARDIVCNRPIQIYAPTAWRPFLHIDDAAEAISLVLEANPALVTRRVFNVVGENHQKTSILGMALKFRPEAETKITDDNPDLRDYRVSGRLFSEILGFRPKRRIEQAFREVATAVVEGRIRDPFWPGHSAIPTSTPQKS